MNAHIQIPLRDPLSRDWDEGEIIVLWETENRSLKFKLIEAALKGEKIVKVIPAGETLQ